MAIMRAARFLSEKKVRPLEKPRSTTSARERTSLSSSMPSSVALAPGASNKSSLSLERHSLNAAHSHEKLPLENGHFLAASASAMMSGSGVSDWAAGAGVAGPAEAAALAAAASALVGGQGAAGVQAALAAASATMAPTHKTGE